MLAILLYFLKVLLCSGLLFGYYWVALRNKHFHGWNRYFLLMVVLLSFGLPFLQIPIFYDANNDTSIILRGLSFGNYGDEVIIRPNNYWQIDWNKVLIVFYASVSLFFLIKLLKTFNWINKIKAHYPSEMLDEISFYNTNENGTPFSFFKNIFWHKDIEPNSTKGLQMLRHEITHVRQLHSVDKLLMEIITIMAWWNPFFHLIKKELSTIHEFIADQQAAHGDDHLQYASLLLQKAFGSSNVPLSNPFFHSQLKRRIAMLTTIKNPRFSYLRRLMVLPLAACMFILLAFKFKEKKNINLLKTPVPIIVIIDAGHGGIDDGALGENGLKEKDISLEIAQKISTLATAKGIKVILTRKSDALPGNGSSIQEGLKQRMAIAANSNADLFISIHVNSGKASLKESGINAFISKTTNNMSSTSQLLASSLLNELEKSGLPVAKTIQQRKENGVYILDKNPVPSVLLELGYISNPLDAKFISNPENQEKLANEILDGIIKAVNGLKAQNNQTTTSSQSASKNVLQGFWQDTTKGKSSKQSTISPKDSKEKLTPSISTTNAETENKVIKTDGSFFVNATKGESMSMEAGAIYIHSDSTKQQPLYFVDGIEFKKEILQVINPKDIKRIDILKDANAVEQYGERAKNGVILIWTKKEKDVPIAMNTFYQDTTKDNDKTFTKVEEPATFPGGLDGWRTYLTKNLRYPEEAQKKNIQGVVRVQLVVDKKGHVSDVKSLNNLGGSLSEEAERVIKTGPDWVPAKQNGKLVTYRFVQTLTFQLR